MADSSPLLGPMGQAAGILRQVSELADAIHANDSSQNDETQRRIATAWGALRPAIIAVGRMLPSEPSPVVDWIREVSRVAGLFDKAIRQHSLAEVLFRFNFDGFIRVADEGQSLLQETAAKRDPFAFIDSTATCETGGNQPTERIAVGSPLADDLGPSMLAERLPPAEAAESSNFGRSEAANTGNHVALTHLPVVSDPLLLSDPFCKALIDCRTRIHEDPERVLLRTDPDATDGLTAAWLYRQATEMPGENNGRAPLVFEVLRHGTEAWQVIVFHPVADVTPIVWCSGPPAGPLSDVTSSRVQRTLDYLQAWVDFRRAKLVAQESPTSASATKSDRAGEQGEGGDSAKLKTAKKSTERGEGLAKLISALTKHHQYDDDGCLNLEPIGNNELARLAGVSESTASGFFSKQFGGHTKYRAICNNTTRLVASLKLLNQEFSPHHLFGAKPPGEDEREDDE